MIKLLENPWISWTIIAILLFVALIYRNWYFSMKRKKMTLPNQVMITCDSPHGEYHNSQQGYIVDFIRGGDDKPYVVVMIIDKLVLVPIYAVKIMS